MDLINMTCSLVGLCRFIALEKSAGPKFIRQFLQTNLGKGFLGPGREGLLFTLSVSLSLSLCFCLSFGLCLSVSLSLSGCVSMNLFLVPSVAVQLRAWGLVTFSSLDLRAV